MLLRARGYEVLTAGDGFAALLALAHSLPDIIISDLNMPNMSGYEFLSVVRCRFPTIPVIVISGEPAGLSFPESNFSDACFTKGQYAPELLLAKLKALIDTPPRNHMARRGEAAAWVKDDKGVLAITCTNCLRTLPLKDPTCEVNALICDFCSFGIHVAVSSGLSAA